MKTVATLTLLFLSILCNGGEVHLKRMIKTYPWIAGTRLTAKKKACFLCHLPRSDEHNEYGQHYFETGWHTGQHDFKIIEHLDSDGDGYTNIEEIQKLTNPGDPNDYPFHTNNLSQIIGY